MGDLYDALSKVKLELNDINSKISQEEDALYIEQGILEELELKNHTLQTKLTELDMEAKMADVELNVAFMKKENITEKIETLKDEIQVMKKRMEEDKEGMENFVRFFEDKKKAFINLQQQNHAQYSKIPLVKVYLDENVKCSYLAGTLADHTNEFQQLKIEYSEELEKLKTAVVENDECDDTGIETIDLEPMSPKLTTFPNTMRDFAAMISKILEENQLMRKRVEELEKKNDGPMPIGRNLTPREVKLPPVPILTKDTTIVVVSKNLVKETTSLLDTASIMEKPPVKSKASTTVMEKVPLKEPVEVTEKSFLMSSTQCPQKLTAGNQLKTPGMNLFGFGNSPESIVGSPFIVSSDHTDSGTGTGTDGLLDFFSLGYSGNFF